LKIYRVHCWIDIETTDEAMARAIAQVILGKVATNEGSVVDASTIGTPVDVAARNKPKRKSQEKLF